MLRARKQAGFSLVELMISIVLSLIVVLGCIQLYLAVLKGSQEAYKSNRLTDELSTLMIVLEKDLRRAGFWQADMGTDSPWINPFTASGTTDIVRKADNTCIRYSYDLDLDSAVDPNEYRAVRLNSSGDVQVANEATNTDCDTGTWSTLTTPEVKVTKLEFLLQQSCLNVLTEAAVTCACTGDACVCPGTPEPACQIVRSVDVTIDGELAQDSTVKKSLQESVKIRNDKFLCGTSC
jgi:prepilin peptidase dependent protein B